MLIPTDPDATRVEFQVPGVGLCAVLQDGTVEYPEAVGETVHETEFGEPHTEVHVKMRTSKNAKILAGSSAVDAVVRAGLLRYTDADEVKADKAAQAASHTTAQPPGSAPTHDSEG